MTSITLQQPELKAMLIEAAAIGAQQAIEEALKKTQTTAPKARKRLNFKEVMALTKLGRSALLRRFTEGEKLYDASFPKPHKLSKGDTAPLYWYEDDIIKWHNNQEAVA
nr:hypothetical protein 7 [Piscirickettsiaceae bacterium]